MLAIAVFLATCPLQGQTPSIDSIASAVEKLQGTEKARAYYLLVNETLRSDVERGSRYMRAMEDAHGASSDKAVLTWLNLARGVSCVRSGRTDSAIACQLRALDFATASGQDEALLRVYSDLGKTNVFAGRAEKGIDYMLKGLRLIERFPHRETELKLHTNIAWAYLELKRYRDCIDQGRKNIQMMEGTEWEWVALYTYNNIAVCYGATGELDSARYYIEKGMDAAKRNNNNQQLANAHFILGKIYAEAGNPDLAIEQYLKARPYREKVGNPFFIVSDLYTISDLYATTGQYRKGLDAGLEALDMARRFKLRMKFDWTYFALAKNYEGIGDYLNASKYYRLWAIAKDSLYKNANAEAIAEMETRFATEKKEQELALKNAVVAEQAARIGRNRVVIFALATTLLLIVIIFLLLRGRLRRKRELLLREAQIQATIESQETERRRFAQDLHDGIGQLISALRLDIHRIHNDTPLEERINVAARAEGLLNDMHREIRSIAFNLMPQTLVQNGLTPALREMSGRITDSGKVAVRVVSFDVPARLESLSEISLYRIIQEWVNNVLKHAGATLIEIQLVGYEDGVTVTIEDDGNGFDVQQLGLGGGYGWKNIRSRVNLIRAEMDVDSNPGRRGTTLIIRVPLKTVPGSVDVAVSPNTQ